MLLELMKECRNFFEIGVSGYVTKCDDTYTIASGVLSPVPDDLTVGQYFAIVDSVLNDGIFLLGADGAITGDYSAVDEEFTGTIYPLKVPRDFVQLATDITSWRTNAGESSPYVSERFPDYQYQKAQGANGAAITWQKQFADRIAPYRRMIKGLSL